VRLTPKGVAQFATVAKAHEEWVNKLLQDFGSDETGRLVGEFEDLADRIRNGGTRT
jgi:DNA-binding MarR family transcriptional regulator